MALPAFQKLGRSYYISVREFSGLCLASRDALYLFANRDLTEDREDGAGGRLVGGLLGGAVGGFIGKRVAQSMQHNEPDYSHLVRFRKVGDLPASVLQHPEWPLRNKHPSIAKLPVLVIKREEVSVIAHPSYSTALKLKLGRVPISILYTPFKGKVVRDYLHQAGWPLNWCGWTMIAREPGESPPVKQDGRHR